MRIGQIAGRGVALARRLASLRYEESGACPRLIEVYPTATVRRLRELHRACGASKRPLPFRRKLLAELGSTSLAPTNPWSSRPDTSTTRYRRLHGLASPRRCSTRRRRNTTRRAAGSGYRRPPEILEALRGASLISAEPGSYLTPPGYHETHWKRPRRPPRHIPTR